MNSNLFAQRNESVGLTQQPSQNIRQLHDQLARRIRIEPHQRRNRVQRVEQEVRIDLALQRLHARLHQQALLLFQLHLDARVVPDLQRNADAHQHRRENRDCDPDVRTIDRKDIRVKPA